MELAAAALLLWVADCLRYAARSQEPDVSALHIFDITGGCDQLFALLLAILGLTIMAGVALTVGEYRRLGALTRAVGLLLAGAVFGSVAVALLAQDPHSIASGAYIFASWRAFAVGWAHLRSRRDGRE